ncbi:MAG: tRNA uridine-5-carboxymethylaminomethyl(34) synthesis GTPase MnmE, partial [Flavobacteriaceae bacterium]|nr:tRNA uridine-5-carboxymethylaminomethyl(34) synthesis GTPase MnmE [Flavobacteriaceae bacterium]
IVYLVDGEEAVANTSETARYWKDIQERYPNTQLLMLINKIDTLPKASIAQLQQRYPQALYIAAKTKTGIDSLQQQLLQLVAKGNLSNNETIVSNSRHFEALQLAYKSIQAVKEGVDAELSTDLLAIDLHECLRQLGVLTGEFDVDKDILGNIFSNFCIGK